MAVEIPISANASSVVDEFNKIRQAIAAARGEASAFSAIDLSHGELNSLGGELQAMAKNFDDLNRIGRGPTAAGVRSATGRMPGQSASPEENAQQFVDYLQKAEKIFPNAQDRKRNVNNVVRYVTQDTSLGGDDDEDDDDTTPNPKPQLNPKPKKERFFQRHGRRIGGGLAAAAGGDAAAAGAAGDLGAMALGLVPELGVPLLALAGIGGIGKMIGKGVAGATDEANNDDSFLRTIQGSTQDFNTLRDAARAASDGLMLTYQQSAALGANFAKLANISDPNQALDGMKDAVGFGRATGIDADTAVNAFGSANIAGIDPERFALLIGQAASKGDMTSQTGQVMQAILSFAQNASRYMVLPGAINAATSNYASMYASMNAARDNGTIDPGLHGANAEALLGTINSSVMSGGAAGEAGTVAMYQAFGQAGIRDPYAVTAAMQSGAFAPVVGDKKNRDTFQIMQDYINKTYSGNSSEAQNERNYAGSRFFGITMGQYSAVDRLKPADVDATGRYMSGIGITPDNINMAALPSIVDLQNNPGTMQTIKAQLLGDSRLSGADSSAITGAKNDKDLMAALVKGLNDTGLPQDAATKLAQAGIDAQNKLTGAATGLLPIMTNLQVAEANLLRPLEIISTALADLTGVDPGKSMVAPASDGTQTRITAHGVAPAYPGSWNVVAPANPNGRSRGERDNNPLNVMYAPGDNATGFEDQSGSGFHEAVYSNVSAGLASAIAIVKGYQKSGLTTLAQIDEKFTPLADNPNEPGILANIENDTGLNGSQTLNNSDIMKYLADKAKYESGMKVSPGDMANAQKIQVTIAPLTVKHTDIRGRIISSETVPVTTTPPQPYGAAATAAIMAGYNKALTHKPGSY